MGFERTGPERHVVAHHACVRILRREEGIEQPPFAVIHILRCGLEREHVPREIEHIAGVAGFRTRGTRVPGELADLEEALAVSVAPDDIRPVWRHALPEKTRNVVEAFFPGQLIFADSADDLRELRIARQATIAKVS